MPIFATVLGKAMMKGKAPTVVVPPPAFTTLDPANTTGGLTLSETNLRLSSVAARGRSISIGSFSAGLRYFEAECMGGQFNGIAVGVANLDKALGPGGDDWPGGSDNKSTGMFNSNGATWTGGTLLGVDNLQAFPNVGDKVGVHIDATNHTIQFETLGGLGPVYAIPTGVLGAYVFIDDTGNNDVRLNLGASAWAFGPFPGEVTI